MVQLEIAPANKEIVRINSSRAYESGRNIYKSEFLTYKPNDYVNEYIN